MDGRDGYNEYSYALRNSYIERLVAFFYVAVGCFFTGAGYSVFLAW